MISSSSTPSRQGAALAAAPRHTPQTLCAFASLAGAIALSGCATVKHAAIDRLGDAIAAGGTTFASDDDPALVQSAAPFSLKLMESLLAERPRHRGLLLAAASGFAQYTFAFVQQEADEVIEKDFAAGTVLRLRARRLYLRARDYGLRGLELAHPGFSTQLRQDPRATVRRASAADVPLLYWTAAAWGSAITLAKDDADLLSDLPVMEALIDRATELEADFAAGALHGFLIAYEMARPIGAGEPEQRARHHFKRALALTDGQHAGPLVTFAESVHVPRQNRAEFEALLHRALAIDVNARPEWRLTNLVLQRRSRWLLGRSDELFLPPDPPDTPEPATPASSNLPPR